MGSGFSAHEVGRGRADEADRGTEIIEESFLWPLTGAFFEGVCNRAMLSFALASLSLSEGARAATGFGGVCSLSRPFLETNASAEFEKLGVPAREAFNLGEFVSLVAGASGSLSLSQFPHWSQSALLLGASLR